MTLDETPALSAADAMPLVDATSLGGKTATTTTTTATTTTTTTTTTTAAAAAAAAMADDESDLSSSASAAAAAAAVAAFFVRLRQPAAVDMATRLRAFVKEFAGRYFSGALPPARRVTAIQRFVTGSIIVGCVARACVCVCVCVCVFETKGGIMQAWRGERRHTRPGERRRRPVSVSTLRTRSRRD